MASHGGFALALQIRQTTLQQLITLFHRGALLPRGQQGEVTIPDPDPANSGQPATLGFDVYMSEPTVNLNTDVARVGVRLVGAVQIDAPSCDNVTRQVRLWLQVNTAISGSIEAIPDSAEDPDPFPTHELVASFLPISVHSSTIAVIDGPPLPSVWTDFFESMTFRAGLGLELTTALREVHTVLPAELLPVLSTLRIGNGSDVSVTGIVSEGFLTLGVDVVNDEYGVNAIGTASAISKFLSNDDIAFIVNPALSPLLARRLRIEMNNQASGSPITGLSLSFQDGHFAIAGHAEISAGSADFSFHAAPQLGRPATVAENYDDEYGGQYTVVVPASDEIWVDISHLEVDAEFDVWVYLSLVGGAILAGPMLPGAGAGFPRWLADLVDHILTNRKVRSLKKAERPLVNRVITGPLSDREPMDQVDWRMAIKALSVGTGGTLCRATLTPEEAALGNIVGPVGINAEELGNSVAYVMNDALLRYDRADPELHMRWQVRRLDTNQVVKTLQGGFGEAGVFRWNNPLFFPASFLSYGAGNHNITAFSISARVYRSGGGQSADLCNTSLQVKIFDRLNRGHPYCQWHHQVVTPQVVVHPDGTHEVTGKRVFDRKSVIHRTCIPGRCMFAARFTIDLAQPDYLDALPFPLEDLDARRGEVCDYCFYGGPDKTIPLVQPGPI